MKEAIEIFVPKWKTVYLNTSVYKTTKFTLSLQGYEMPKASISFQGRGKKSWKTRLKLVPFYGFP